MLQLLLAPRSGWEDMEGQMARGQLNARAVYARAFVPLLVVCAATAMVRAFYAVGPDFWGALQLAIIEFVALFAGFHISNFGLSMSIRSMLPQGAGVESERLTLVCMQVVSMLALLMLLGNVVRVSVMLLQFVPVYLVYIIWRSCPFVGVDRKNEGLYTLVTSALTIGVVYVLQFLLSLLA